ncbi:heavy metal translocating P-type ATPase [Neopusillimonas aromaticivorans]|uniref:heavy metal translocating P-type ATPase n=1 Tax=Neopusillimonas aromaticivorans TaxID=2979868 RepID=UPI00259774EA|nr:cation-translocating P-type ATPase [Neopusillimonas aromaticivorans]WJJ93607.1 cation-translocating P-type ATPase [Neopusillimonas aromaticivorans]
MSHPCPEETDTRHSCGCGSASGTETIVVAPPKPESQGIPVFRIPTMDCAAEEGEIRHALAKLPGLRSLSFQLGARTLAIDAPAESIPLALDAIRKAGFKPVPLSGPVGQDGDHDHAGHDHPHSLGGVALPEGLPRYVLALVLAFGAELISFFAPHTVVFSGVGMALASVAIGLSGFSTYVKGLAALRNLRLNINALMTVAVTGAFLIGQWPEAAMVMALYALAELIEARSVDRARNAIKGLLDMTPEKAQVRQADGSWVECLVKTVAPGAIVRVKPGVRVPLDGVIVAGATSVDQSPVTGESIPVDKAIGDAVFAGTINATGMVEVQVSSAANGTLLARIIHAVEQAQGSRAPTQQFVDRFAAIYTPSVFTLALAVCLLTPWLMGWTWMQAIYKALVLLVIACPCALVISTPVTVVSGLAAAARRGILIKGGVYLEGARKIKAIALDKTGTITLGKPRLVATEVLPTDQSEPQVLRWASDLAGHSDHPVSKAIAQGLGIQGNGPLEGFTALPGRGIEAKADGLALILGNHRLIEDRGLCSPQIEARLAEHEAQGRTVTMLASSTQVLAIFAVADTIKKSSRDAIAELHALGVASVMLTGDNVATARAIASQAGIDDARANLLPKDKLAAVEEMQKQYGYVAMTGDGINDAPALARSDIGFAMGGAGTDIAMEAADVVIMNDDLRRIPEAIRLSRKTQTILWQNIALALGIKAVFLLLALFNGATMWMAVFADMGASLLVVFNGLRMLRNKC